MKLLAGLGNPGSRYAPTRHNIGFMAIDRIAARYGFRPFRSKFDGEIAEGEIAGEKVLILKPMTFMNESGRSVGPALRFYKVAPADLIVFHDELDLRPGKVRAKHGGGPAGHNGLRSIDTAIGQGYGRVRLGIGHPGAREQVLGYVLDPFRREELDGLALLLEAVADATPLLVTGDQGQFMTRVAYLTGDTAPAEDGVQKPKRGKADAAS